VIYFVLIASFLWCAAGVLLFRRLACGSSRLLDVPNERSSHTRPVVRGAGVAIVLTVLSGYLLTARDAANLVYISSALAIAVVSFIDDIFSIPLLPRLVVHFAAASFLVYNVGGFHGINIPFSGSSISFGDLAAPITIVFVVWITNAFNFMDGIDGIAGSQGFGSGIGWMLYGLVIGEPTLSLLGGIIAGACLGFLIFNWDPASVFMGDVGSTFLGFTLAAIPLVTLGSDNLKLTNGLLLAMAFMWLFLFDATFTRLHQVMRLQKFWLPHREHLYQQIVARGASHGSIALSFGLFALLIAVSINLMGGRLGQAAAAVLLFAGPMVLLWFAWRKRLT
jgi:Fuc2NAc and GlcNAc transferase